MVSDSIRYEAQPIPPHEPDQGTRWPTIIGAVAVIAVLLAGVAFGATLFRGEPDPEAEAPGTSISPRTPTTLTSPLMSRDQRADGFGGGDMASRPYYPDRVDLPPTPPLPTRQFTWEKVTLDLPGTNEAYLQGVYAVGDGFVALGTRSSEDGESVQVLWKSDDGTTWTPTELTGDFSNASVWNVVFTDYGAIAFGEEWAGPSPAGDIAFREYLTPARVVWTSPDGVTWTRATIDLRTGDNQEVWINTGTVGPDGYVIAGQRSASPEFEPIIVEKDGYRLELSEASYTYRVLDAAGNVLVQGSMDDIYGWTSSEDGQVIINPDTGDTYTVIPFEVWEQAWNDAYRSEGPFGSFGYQPAVVTLEYDGYRVVVDEEFATYRIEDAATGEVLYSGSADYLWRGPAPVITDDAGNEILRFSWEEFDAARESYWNSEGFDESEYWSQVVVATSTDGLTWTEGTVDPGTEGASFDTVIADEDGYIAFGTWYDRTRGGSAVWTSTNGSQWQQSGEPVDGRYLWNVHRAVDGTYLSLSDGPGGQALWSSSDGITWSEAFGPRIPEDPGMNEWLGQFGTGELGTVIVGNREQAYYDEGYYSANPLTLTRGDYTLTFDDYDWPPRVTVVDAITGDVVIDVRLQEEGGLPAGFTYEDGVTSIQHNDVILMAITDEEWYAAQDERWMTLERNYVPAAPQPTLYFTTDLDTWTEVPVDFGGWFGYIAVGRGAVVLSGEEYYEEPRLLEPETEYGEGYIYRPSAPVLYIGRP